MMLRLCCLAGVLLLAFCTTSATAGSIHQTPAYYLVCQRHTDGTISIVYSTAVTLRVPLRSLSDAQMQQRLARRSRSRNVIAVTLRDARGRTTYQNTVSVPRWRRGEFLKRGSGAPGESNIDGHVVPLEPATFVVRVPRLRGGTMTLRRAAGARKAAFALDALVAAHPGGAGAAAASVEALAGWSNGDPANRVDVLIMGDGYTAAQQSQFDTDASQLANQFFQLTPYAEYRNYVNISALFVPSAQSGADQPPYDPACDQNARAQTCCSDPGASGVPAAFVDTAFDATYCSQNVERLLTVDETKVFAAAAVAPDWDQIMVIVNDPTYGGSGDALMVVSTDPLAVNIAQHEYGHSFTRLADEYENPFPGYPPCSDVDPTLPNCEPNVTDETTRALIKWNRWIAPSMLIPSVGPPPTDTDAGLWEGARYLSSGMYRQGYDCLMRSLGRPFCDVASEAYAIRLYSGGWGVPANGIDNIEPGSENPAPGDVTAGGTIFNATVLGPADGPALTATWYVNGQAAATSAASSGSTVSFELTGNAGDTVELQVTDNSPIIHPSVRALLASRRDWTFVEVPATSTPTMMPTPTPTPTLAPYGIDGHILSYGGMAPVGAVALALDDGVTMRTTTTDVNGAFTFANVGGHSWTLTPAKPGDAGTGISALDAVYVLQTAAGLRTLDSDQQLACDVSGNGTVTALDAVLILQRAAGLIARFPVAETCNSDWAFVPVPAPAANQQVIMPKMQTGSCQHGAIVYDPLLAQASNQDFVGILFGDCTGNWTAPAGAAAPLSRRRPITRGHAWLGKMRRLGHGRVAVPVYAVAAGGVLSLDIDVHYDRAQLRAAGVHRLRPTRHALLAYNLRTPGRVRIALASATPIADATDPILLVLFTPTRSHVAAGALRASNMAVNDRPAQN